MEYDYNEKEFYLSKKEIKSNKTSFLDRFFNDVIDCKDESIITTGEEGIKLWIKSNTKYYKEKYFFSKILL